MRTSLELVQKDTMGLKLRRRSVYVGTIVAMLAMVGGVALATFTTGGHSTVYQGNQAVTVSGVAGLTYVSTTLGIVPASGITTACSSANAAGNPCDTSDGANACISTCTPGDYAEIVSITVAAGGTPPLTFNIMGDFNGGAFETTYFSTTGAGTGGGLVLYLDIGTGSTTVTSLNIIANSP